LAISEIAVYFLRFVLTAFGLWNTKTIAFISDPAFTQVFNAVFSVNVSIKRIATASFGSSEN
jgi:hypothetical protein